MFGCGQPASLSSEVLREDGNDIEQDCRTDLGGAEWMRSGPGSIPGAVGFVLLYFSVDFVAPNLATSALPLPAAALADARAWFAENRLATVMPGLWGVSFCPRW
jgi:hypothetical protein